VIFNPSLRFSPTSSSILGRSSSFLRVWRLHELSTSSETRPQQYVEISRCLTYIATARELGNTITITDLLAQNPPQFIDTNVEIQGLVITGNVLLVAGSGQLVAWLLTEDGLVDGVIGDRRVDRSDSIWAISQSTQVLEWEFLVEGQVGFVTFLGSTLRVYDTETGEALHTTQAPWDPWYARSTVGRVYFDWDYLRSHKLRQGDIPPGDMWQTTLQKGWVKDAQGKHRLWVPVEWRVNWNRNIDDWYHDVTTQFTSVGNRVVVIKF